MRICNKHVKNYLGKGRYLPLEKLTRSYRLVGVVVHDEVGGFCRALNKHGFSAKPIRIGTRFKARVVSKGRRCILLVGTGMGCTGSSIVIYELALQQQEVPILKVGTCVSTWESNEVGTILVPRWAVADDGVVEWDGRACTKGHDLQQEIKEVFKHKRVVGGSQGFQGWVDSTP